MRGFTLIELMVSTAILASFLALGVPAMQGMIERHESNTAFYNLRRTFANARGLAQDKSINVSVCPIQGADCTSSWDDTVTVFNDRNFNNTVDEDEVVFFSTSISNRHGYWLKTKSNQSYVRFNPLGHAFSSASTFLYCPYSDHDKIAKSIVISFQGRIRTAPYLNKQGIPYAKYSTIDCN
ncbi:GspH/FimT family pseudopilin [Pseudomonas sp. HK3]